MTRRPLAICVFCSSSDRVDRHHFDIAHDTGRMLASRGHRLVYGGGSVGLMGQVARAAKAHGGHVTGVIPGLVADVEFEYEGCDELVRTDSMRQRKTEMERRSDAFLVLPGGIGTLDEMFEILTLRLLDQHAKPVVIVNTLGFYDHLLRFMDHLHETRFNRERTRSHYSVVHSPEQAIDHLERA